jgi:hypothetical protein
VPGGADELEATGRDCSYVGGGPFGTWGFGDAMVDGLEWSLCESNEMASLGGVSYGEFG